MKEFAELLEQCSSSNPTKTSRLLLSLYNGHIDDEHLLTGDIPMFINKSVTESGKISYANKNRIEYYSWSDEHASNSENRQRVKSKVGKVMTKIFTSSFLDTWYDDVPMCNDVEAFTSQLKALAQGNVYNHEFNIGACFDNYQYYNTCDSAQDERGSLGESCMRHEECYDDGYFDIYEHSQTPVKLITYDCPDEGGIRSRALLWNIDGKEYLDRIYETWDGDSDKFKQLAHNNGWYHKLKQSYANKVDWVKDGKTIKIPLIVPVATFNDLRAFPYIDTFTYGFTIEGQSYLTNDREYANKKFDVTEFRVFECTGGGYNHSSLHIVYKLLVKDDGTISYSKHADFGDLAYKSVSYDNASPVLRELLDDIGKSSVRFATYDATEDMKQAIVYSSDGGKYYHISECAMCEYHKDYYPKDQLTRLKWEGKLRLLKRSSFVVDYKGDWQPKNSCRVFIDGNGKGHIINEGLKSENHTVVDFFGVRRLKRKCVLFDCPSGERYFHNSQTHLAVMIDKQMSNAKKLRDIETNMFYEHINRN